MPAMEDYKRKTNAKKFYIRDFYLKIYNFWNILKISKLIPNQRGLSGTATTTPIKRAIAGIKAIKIIQRQILRLNLNDLDAHASFLTAYTRQEIELLLSTPNGSHDCINNKCDQLPGMKGERSFYSCKYNTYPLTIIISDQAIICPRLDTGASSAKKIGTIALVS